ncbi:hypothetical protein KHM19_32200 [Leptospira borgpetersenii]|uniref:Uncharacterized protein n=1 Tax=Leptospira borgpetersenii serovar Pomona str. 200901868 TaxID=1192866 RepID=M6WFT6_LEPBO|nr:hypothetical protein LEP1GSC133_0983 [Leptospira borgpetersenii serovar Pomona str. 200901868]GIM20778.1 hypothetical protein KHM09_32290 [Leptospira borgpetersenii]GIM24037.1 hypothetical protein KHM19_32200 [Leptospira borgpetersenii]GIM27291.1 hypothetical protein KHM25_32160 [Leptospira borgpetersenii]
MLLTHPSADNGLIERKSSNTMRIIRTFNLNSLVEFLKYEVLTFIKIGISESNCL